MNCFRVYSLAAVVAVLATGGCNGTSGSGGLERSIPAVTMANAKHRIHKNLDSSDITEYTIPTNNSFPIGITTGPDGALWFAEHKAARLGRITISGNITEFANLSGKAHCPLFAVTGADGNIWVTADNDPSNKALENKHDNRASLGSVLRVTPQGAVTEYPLPTQFSDPRQIVKGPDGAVWLGESVGTVGTMTTSGALTEYNTPDGSRPFGLGVGPDGALWFGESVNDELGRITVSGAISLYAFPKNSGPTGVVAGPDGNLWVTEFFANKVAKVSTSGVILSEYPTSAYPRSIVAGSDGNLYFTEYGAGKIGQLTVGGVLTEIATPTPNSAPFSLTAGPDGNVWFTESATGKIGKLSL